jgi:hypothetical protein
MTGRLAQVLTNLLTGSLADLLGGAAPPVTLSFVPAEFTIDPQSVEPEAGEPRIDDQLDTLPFDPAAAAGPYTLTKPPAPGPRRVRLVTAQGDRIPVSDGEIHIDPLNSRSFTLALRPDRDLTGVNGLQVLYGVTAVFVKIKALHSFALQLQGGTVEQLDQGQALVAAVVELNRKAIVEQSSGVSQGGDYAAQVTVQNVKLLKGSAPAANTRLLEFTAEIELKAMRALGADEGKPILRIASPGRAPDPNHPVDINVEVDA